MDITPQDQLLLDELDKAIKNEMELIPIRETVNRSSYSRDDTYVAVLTLSSRRQQILDGLANLRITALQAAARLTS